jgi:hypothetical protein
MTATAEARVMARSKGRPKSGRDDVTTKIDRRLVGLAHLIAKDEGVSVAELLSEMLRGPIEKKYDKLVLKAEKRGSNE